MKLFVFAFVSCCLLGFVAAMCDDYEVAYAMDKCSARNKQEYELVVPKPGDSSPEAHKFFCCMLELDKRCMSDLLKGKGCENDINLFLEDQKENMKDLFGTSKCHFQCNNKKSAGRTTHLPWTLATVVSMTSIIKLATF
ncbi:uncharacterized protein LOC135369965 [Ornithodoros turicata]|uniref:uncharacterized protein LOC135369965 n=1 Tax=Ornithodoros turicata TaxID=34597 RepID=UPI0031386990